MPTTTTTPSLPPLSHLQWRAPEWITAFGPLTKAILMDYFVLSPFFDPASNNAALRMQIMFSRQAGGAGTKGGGMEGLDEEAELRRFKGIEYVVVHDDAPGLFIIHKRDRQSPTQAHTIAAYHILNDSIYQAPSLYQLVNERLLASLHALSTSLNALKANQPNWSTVRGAGRWKIRQTAATIVTSTTGGAEGLGGLGGEESKKRAREDGVDEVEVEDGTLALNPLCTTSEAVQGLVDEGGGEEQEQDLYARPSETFNPLLFNALDRVARHLPVPIQLDESKPTNGQKETLVDGEGEGEQGQGQGGKGNKKEEGAGAGTGTGVGQSSTEIKGTTSTNSGTGKNKVTQGANGKRVPRKALQVQAAGGV